MDSGPRLLVKLKSMKDKESEKILDKILNDEETHVASGVKWYGNISEYYSSMFRFQEFCIKNNENPRDKFRELAHNLGIKIFPPFNKEGKA